MKKPTSVYFLLVYARGRNNKGLEKIMKITLYWPGKWKSGIGMLELLRTGMAFIDENDSTITIRDLKQGDSVLLVCNGPPEARMSVLLASKDFVAIQNLDKRF